MASRYGKFGKSVRQGVLVGDRLSYSEDKKKKSLDTEKEDDKPYVSLDPESPTNDIKGTSTNPLLQLKELPKLYEGEGKDRKINPAYDTSIGKDILAGGAIASQNPTGNPFYDLGASLGGLVGGAFNKNLAGKMEYEKDVARIQAENKDTIVKTEAYQRAETQKRLQEAEARRQQGQAFRQQMQTQVAQERDAEKRTKMLQDMIQVTSGEDREWAQQELAKTIGRDPEAIKDDFGLAVAQKKFGEVVMNVTKGGEARYMMIDGQVVTDLSPQDWIKILNDTEKGDYSPEAITSARQEATRILNENRELFKTNKGGFDAQRFNAQVFTLSRDILKGRKNGEMPKEIMVNGVLIPLDGKTAPSATPPLQNDSPAGNSQFMPPLSDEQQKIYDATQGQPPANIPRTPVNKEEVWTKFQANLPNMNQAQQNAINASITELKENEEVDFRTTVDGVVRTITIKKVNGKPSVVSIQ